MPTVTERVDRLEEIFSRFMERTEEALLDIRASNARTDTLLLEMQKRADRDRERAERERQQDRERAERDRKDFNKRLAELSDSMGTLIEDMVAPNALRIASEIFGADAVVTVAQRVKRHHPADRARMMEIDLLVGGSEHVMVVEAKRKLNTGEVRDFVERIGLLPEFFPEYADLKLLPVVASVNIDPSVVSFLNRQRVYGVAMGDETMHLVNAGQF